MTPAQALEQAWRNHPDLPEVEFTEAELECLAGAVLIAAIELAHMISSGQSVGV